MNIKKNVGFVVGGGVSVALMLGAAGYLVVNLLELNLVKESLAEQNQELLRLESRASFPNQKNVIIESNNAKNLSQDLRAIVDLYSRHQSEAEPMDNVSFGPSLKQKVGAMRDLAKENGVKLATTFSFGFDRYAAGAIPSAAHAGRLGNQLLATEQVFNVLCNEGAALIDQIGRDTFDHVKKAQRRPRTRNRKAAAAPKPAEAKEIAEASYVDRDGLYSCERINVVFLAKEEAVWSILNSFAKSERFMVVKDLQTFTSLPVLGFKPAEKALERKSDDTVLTHEQRVVAGGEMVKVSLGVDVVRFAKKIPGVNGE